MNMYEIAEIATGKAVTGALTYSEAMSYMQKNRLSNAEYDVRLYMPTRKTR